MEEPSLVLARPWPLKVVSKPICKVRATRDSITEPWRLEVMGEDGNWVQASKEP